MMEVIQGQERKEIPVGTGLQQLIRRLTDDLEDNPSDRVASDNKVDLEDDQEGPVNLPAPGAPFSALLPSMLPDDLAGYESNTEDPNSQPAYRYDEFGFRVEEEDGPEHCSSKLLSIPFIESPRRQLQWTVELGLENDKQTIRKSSKLDELVKSGIPHSLRKFLWPILLDTHKKKTGIGISYREILSSSSNENSQYSKQIEKDLLRTMPNNVCFAKKDSVGVPRLRRVLRAVSWIYPDVGYCQGMGMIASTLLLFLPEEETFWCMASIIDLLLPSSYYSSNLWGAQADQRVLRSLVAEHLPEVDNVLKEHDIEISLITLQWFITLYSSCLHIKIVLRIWDLLFHYGTSILFKVGVSMLKTAETRLLTAENSAQIFNILSSLPHQMDDVDALMDSVIQLSDDLINREKLEMLRRKHLSEIMSDESSFSLHMDTSRPVPRPWTLNRKLNRSKSIVGILIGDDEENKLDPRCKNIKRTEQLVYLKEAILRIGTFFQGLDPLYQNIKLQPDYSFESHTRDIEVYMCTSVNKRRRARALLDFERQDSDELGFRKYDIINLVSTDDDHCWVGELNGLVGWFPAKFVELIDERSKEYSQAGDDKVTQAITDLVRGSLCSSLKHILENGLKPPSILTGPVHPWMFIQEAATEEVNKDKTSVFSRLNLCSTFRLDDDAKVLTPDELLYRCVQFINQSHDKVNAKMDVKLRSLICMGLNEQVLHLWLECLCAADKSLCKYYNNTAILASPGWVLVKCELRILAQFSFQLSPDWELKSRNEDKSSFTHGVKDMLVKHHLFSWDL